MSGKPSSEEVNETVQRILSSPEFSGILPEARRESATVQEPRPAPPVRGPSTIDGLPIMAVILAAVLVVALLASLITRAERSRRLAGPPNAPSRSVPPPDPLHTAEELASKGDYAAGLVFLFSSYLAILQRQGLILVQENKTNFQYELELSRKGYQGLPAFREFKRAFNDIRFGGRQTDQGTYETWLAFCRRLISGGGAR